MAIGMNWGWRREELLILFEGCHLENVDNGGDCVTGLW